MVKGGNLSRAPMVLATMNGILRAVGDCTTMDDVYRMEQLKADN